MDGRGDGEEPQMLGEGARGAEGVPASSGGGGFVRRAKKREKRGRKTKRACKCAKYRIEYICIIIRRGA